MADVRRNDDAGQYEVWLDGVRVGLTQFRVRPDGVLVFPHTEVDEDRRGQGLAGELIGGAIGNRIWAERLAPLAARPDPKRGEPA